ncbi:MAG: hypothetical protein ACFFDB_16350 [Promethearchaeota archaeon]
MSKDSNVNNLISSWEKEGTFEKKKKVLERVPRNCLRCGSVVIEYWDETDEEIIFQCNNCKRFITIPYKQDDLKFYFTT